MIKIVKQGVIPTYYQIKCIKCHCVFNFEDEDITDSDYLSTYDAVVCPCCNLRLYLVDGRRAYYYREEDDNG